MSGAATLTVVSVPLLPVLVLPVLPLLAWLEEEPELQAASPVASAVIAKTSENQ
jgi:hypothetical protein